MPNNKNRKPNNNGKKPNNGNVPNGKKPKNKGGFNFTVNGIVPKNGVVNFTVGEMPKKGKNNGNNRP